MSSRRRRSRRDRRSPWRATLLVLLLCLAAAEASPWLLGWLIAQPYDRAATLEALGTTIPVDSTQADRPAEEYLGDHYLHPYLGYVSVPLNDRNRFGLPGADPLHPGAPDTVNVVLLGGSVAMGLHTFAEERLLRGLQRVPAFRGKAFRVAVLALGGYKQPQPLQALSWFLAQGAHMDLVLALDGFNDIVLPMCDNLPFGIHSNYPRHWNMYARKRLDPKVQRILAQRLAISEHRDERRHRLAASQLRHSNIALLLWRTRDQRDAAELTELEQRLRTTMENAGADLQVTGPVRTVTDTAAYRAEQADLWMRSSMQVNALARANGAAYFHFLQPNQYVPGSKPIGPKEAAVALAEGPFCYRDAVEQGYPLLIERGARLKVAGVDFHDLTGLFRTEPRAMYSDQCCHFTTPGYLRIAEAMADAVVEGLKSAPAD
ncbi:MAG TPA: hypothetical protein PLH93_03385 [Flavobacteriales bacterium]|nr:hypothetical protein [Flavobacteriales bacterium]